MTTAAFIGWQVAGSFAGDKVGPFHKYLRNFGLAPKHTSSGPRQSPDEIASAAVEKARAASRRKAVPQ